MLRRDGSPSPRKSLAFTTRPDFSAVSSMGPPKHHHIIIQWDITSGLRRCQLPSRPRGFPGTRRRPPGTPSWTHIPTRPLERERVSPRLGHPWRRRVGSPRKAVALRAFGPLAQVVKPRGRNPRNGPKAGALSRVFGPSIGTDSGPPRAITSERMDQSRRVPYRHTLFVLLALALLGSVAYYSFAAACGSAAVAVSDACSGTVQERTAAGTAPSCMLHSGCLMPGALDFTPPSLLAFIGLPLPVLLPLLLSQKIPHPPIP